MKNNFLLALSFVSGMSIMAMEISAARLLAPFFGTSLFVWTNIIAVVLVALSFGYYFGGKFADKHPKLSYLLYLILASGIFFLFVPWLVSPLANFIVQGLFTTNTVILSLFFASFIVSLILFAFPLFLLGMTSPFVIRLYDAKMEDLGSTAGTIFAVGTTGSIIGTFLPTLYLIPHFGTRSTILIFSIVLISIAVIGLSRKPFAFLILLLLIVPLSSISAQQSEENIIYSNESIYQHIEVRQDEDGSRKLLYNEGLGIQSVYYPDRILSGSYYDDFLPFISNGDHVAIIGLAGGTLAREIFHFYPDATIDGVEIDRKVTDVAREFFFLDERTNVIVADGRQYLDHSEEIYDVIVIDAYQNELYVPWTMVTEEFWTITHERLRDNGIVLMNMNAGSIESPLLKTTSNTLASVFNHVYILKHNEDASFNFIVIASQEEMVISEAVEILYNSNEQVFTDDKAPVELMTDAMILNYVLQ